jgi:hypothetical protein
MSASMYKKPMMFQLFFNPRYCRYLSFFGPFCLNLPFKLWGALLAYGSHMSASVYYKKVWHLDYFLPVILRDNCLFYPFRLILPSKRWGTMLASGSLMSVSLYKKLEISWIFYPWYCRILLAVFLNTFYLTLPLNAEEHCWLMGPRCQSSCTKNLWYLQKKYTRYIRTTCLQQQCAESFC